MSAEKKPTSALRACFSYALLCIFLSLLISTSGFVPFEFLFHLIGGWIIYLKSTLPKIGFNLEMILCGIGALTIAIWMSHRFINWFRQQQSAPPWRLSATLSLTGLLLLSFGSAIAMTGIIHQSAWLLREDVISQSGMGKSVRTLHQGRQLAFILYSIENDTGSFPKNLDDINPKVVEIERGKLIKLTHPYGNRWLYFGDQAPSDEEEKILLLYPVSEDNKWIVIYSDGSGTITKIDNFDHPLLNRLNR